MSSYYEKFLATGEVKCIDDEIPFEIPKSWEWSRLGDICSYLHRGKSPKYGEHKFLPIIAQKCNQWDKIYTDRCLFSSKDYIEKYKEEQFVQKGDIIINSTGGGTVGRTGYIDSYVFANFDRFVVDSHVTLVRSIYPIASKYVYYFLISPLIQIGLEDRCSGSTNQIELGTTTITSYLVPIPPIKEQYRIIDQFQKVLPLLERYSTNQIAQDKLNAEINIQLKKSILQEAIQGKLVPQIAEEGTAQELLEQIRQAKLKLVKEGKLKKAALNDSIISKGDDNKYYEQVGKDVYDITEEIAFDLPDSWAWVRFGQYVRMSIGKTPPRGETKYWTNGKYPWVSISDMSDYGMVTTTKESVSEYAKSLFGEISPVGTLIMSFKLTVGRTSLLNTSAYHNEAIISIYPFVDKNCQARNYLFHILPIISNLGDSKDAIKGKTLNSKSLNNLLLPLPPLDEQGRIVAMIELLFDKLK